ncbi:ribosomal protein S18-alanine N-acetyltransferase [Candidatus Bathyarchaeota archaeon]|nr:ribosomal protein S18-alanine N-acetyltransferase [Candidatus Bathyarchaeota archaeon]
MKEEYTVRLATKVDLPSIYEIENRSFKDPYPPFFIEILLNLNPKTFLVAEREKQIVGYLITTYDRNTGHIVSIAIISEERRKNVGRTLMEKGSDILRELGVETIRLEVRKSNREAQKFYEAQGFEYNHEIRGYYGDDDALVYYKGSKTPNKENEEDTSSTHTISF